MMAMARAMDCDKERTDSRRSWSTVPGSCRDIKGAQRSKCGCILGGESDRNHGGREARMAEGVYDDEVALGPSALGCGASTAKVYYLSYESHLTSVQQSPQ
jgi:hypothetical protein